MEPEVYGMYADRYFKDIKSYREFKVKILLRDFEVSPSHAELAQLSTKTTETAVDNYCRTILKNHWESD